MLLLVTMECLLSATFLRSLCMAGTIPDAIFVADRDAHGYQRVQTRVNLIRNDDRVDQIAHRYGITLFRVNDWNLVPDAFLTQFAMILVACYPKKLPAARFLRIGVPAWNVHPSALPALRGPDPLFYVARGDAEPAVTIHELDVTYDTGPIIATLPVDLSEECTERQTIITHATVAADLYRYTTNHLHTPFPQGDSENQRWAAIPTAEDFTLRPEWTMRRTARFVMMTDMRNQPYRVPEADLWVRRIEAHGQIPIRCVDGVLMASL